MAESMRSKFAGVDTGELFDLTPGAAQLRGQRERPKPPRVTRWGHCPGHSHDVRVGLLQQGEHLVWKQHDVTTTRGTRVPCRISGVPLCRAPERAGHPFRPQAGPEVCTHDRPRGIA